MNGAVSEVQFKGFSLRLRTASSGSYVLPPLFSNNYSVENGEVNFFLSAAHANALTEGQYYKIQIAYCASSTSTGTGEDIGYYSTVGVAKCVSKPTVTIRNLVYENINAFNNEYFGFYDLSNCKDRTEKVYSYEFKIYDEQDNVFYTTGEKLHQSYYDTEYTSSIDRVTINDFASTEVIYSIQYVVTTLNGLVLSSPKYKISSQYLVTPNGNIKVVPEADEENGVIIVHLLGENDPNHSYYYVINEDVLNALEVDEEGKPLKDSGGYTMISKTAEVLSYQKDNDKLAFLRANSLYRRNNPGNNAWFYTYLSNTPGGLTAINGKYYHKSDIEGMYNIPQDYLDQIDSYEKLIPGKDILQSLTYNYVQVNFIDLSKKTVISHSEYEKKYYGSYLLSRASDEDNYTTWFNIARFKLDDQMPSTYSVRDVSIEHGRKYKYAIQQYNIWGLYSARIVSDVFEASFEDAFLFDGEKSLRIRYNPTVDSFKTTILEQKTDTIGGRFPFITRNGATYYKEFPLGGLLAQEIDEWHQFVDPEWDHAHRHSTAAPAKYDSQKNKYYLADSSENALWNSHDFSDTTIALERNFKLKVLEWLNDGKPKLFKSPYEGNYIVRLMNVSLSPVKELGRMLHSFTSQAYEIAECTYDNLVAYGFIKTNIPTDLIGLWSSYKLDEMERDSEGNVIIKFENGVQNFTVQDLMPGDMIYLKFIDQDEELPIMIGITGSYTYEGISNNLVQIRIPQPEDHELTGIINCFYTGMRITDFDSITNMMLKTIVSQQYVGTSPWMQRLKHFSWDPRDPETRDIINRSEYDELQNYNFRTYLDQTVSPLGEHNYAPSQNFVRLVRSFDPGELLDRINLTIDKGNKFKTEILNMEMLRFRQRPLIPVYCINNYSTTDIYVPGEFSSLLNEREKKEPKLLCSTSPYGYPHPIEELSEYEMVDPFCIYEVFQYNSTLDMWQPFNGPQYNSYYDPYYRTWLDKEEDYDPTVKIGFTWVPVAFLESRLMGYCSEGELSFLKSNYGNTEGKYWASNDINNKFNMPNSSINSLSENPEGERVIPIYCYTDESQELYNNNKKHQENKRKLERGEYVDQALNEREMFDYPLQFSYYDNEKQITYYYYTTKKGNKEFIKSNKFDLFEKINDMYFATGENNIQPNTVYWYKEYETQLNMTTEKFIEYKNLDLANSYHIGNGVVAELTFQIRIIDYYTEIYDADVRAAKERYLNEKAFYTELMKTYNIIAKANLERNINYGFKELYYRMLRGNRLNTGLDESDENSIINALNQPKSKEELKLMSLYEITTINQAHNRDIINLLINYKKTYQDSNILEAFQAAELYHYYKENVNKIIDEYYIIDNRNFTDKTNNFYIIDNTYELDTDDKLTTYYYENGNTYYYKVNKDKYVDEYNNNSMDLPIDGDELAILLQGFDDQQNPIFTVIQKSDLDLMIYKLYELEPVEEPLTISYLDLLNSDELTALLQVPTCLDANLMYTDKNLIDRELFEEGEILSILDERRLDGAENKLKTITAEIDELNAQISEKQIFVNNLKVTYIDLFKKAFDESTGEITKYNSKVYLDWAARLLHDAFNDDLCTLDPQKGKTNVAYLSNVLGVSADNVSQLKLALINAFNEIQEQADVEISENIEKVGNWLHASNQLYNYISGDLPNVQQYIQMQKDNPQDELLDEVLEKKIIITRGKIVLEFLAIFNAIANTINMFNSGDLTEEEKTSYIETLQTSINQYNYLYEQLIYKNDEEGLNEIYNDFKKENEELTNDQKNNLNQLVGSFKKPYRDISGFLQELTNDYLTIYALENDKARNALSMNDISSNILDLANIVKLSNDFVDYMFIYNMITTSNNHSSKQLQDNDQVSLQGLNVNFYPIGYKVDQNYNVQNIEMAQPPINGTWIDPFDFDSDDNIFKPFIAGWSNLQIQQANTLKEVSIFHYRKKQNENPMQDANFINPFPYFIFNPLSTTLCDSRYRNNFTNNYEIFNSIDTAEHKNQVLSLHKTLASYVQLILNSISGNDLNTLCSSIKTNYIQDPDSLKSLYTEQYRLLNSYTAAGQTVTSPVAMILQKVNDAKSYLIDRYPDGYDIIGYGPVSDINDLIVQMNTPMPEYYHIPWTYGKIYKENDESYSSYADSIEYSEENANYHKPVVFDAFGSASIGYIPERDGTEISFGNNNGYYVYGNSKETTYCNINNIQDQNADGLTAIYAMDNWYQPIIIPDSMLALMTKLKNENTDIEESGIYYSYINSYLDEINKLIQIVHEAEILQRLYQKQVDVYTAKYDKYVDEYETNQAIYSSYNGTEALDFYNLLNSENISEEEKKKRVQSYKGRAQEAWWQFLNLLDARYSAEKERGMYV